MNATSIQIQKFIFLYCTPVQDIMVGGIYESDSVVRVLYIYGLHLLMKYCKCIMWEDTNKHDEYAVNDQLYSYLQ